MTFNYEISKKKFVAVCQYDKTDEEKTYIIEINPVRVTGRPIRVEQSTVQGKVITTSNTVE